jgi:hypothetical protein
MTDCELMVIDRRDFIPVLRGEPDVALKLIETLCARIRRTSEQVEDVMYLSLPARLAKTLLELTGGAEASAVWPPKKPSTKCIYSLKLAIGKREQLLTYVEVFSGRTVLDKGN